MSVSTDAPPARGESPSPARFPARQLPARAGAGFKPAHAQAILHDSYRIGFLEVHAENYMGAGGPPHHLLTRMRERFALSIHGVGLSIGAEAGLDPAHLQRLRTVVRRYEPALVSEHLAWSTHDGHYLNDLLPVAYDRATLDRVCDHLDAVQDALARTVLLENPSTYVAFTGSTMSETDFIGEIARRTGCGLLLDVNNVFVSATNQNERPLDYLDAFPLGAVGEIHLAGHAEDRDEQGRRLLIDAHDRPVADPVWALYETVIARTGPLPTLIEWDNEIPDWPVLRAEAQRAEALLARHTRTPSSEVRHAAAG